MQAPGGAVRLQEIRLEETDGQARITLDAGEQPQGFQHVVEQPVAVGYEVTDDKNDVEIAIDNEAGLTTIIHLRNPILPQTMRGDLEPEMRKDNPDPDDLGEL